MAGCRKEFTSSELPSACQPWYGLGTVLAHREQGWQPLSQFAWRPAPPRPAPPDAPCLTQGRQAPCRPARRTWWLRSRRPLRTRPRCTICRRTPWSAMATRSAWVWPAWVPRRPSAAARALPALPRRLRSLRPLLLPPGSRLRWPRSARGGRLNRHARHAGASVSSGFHKVPVQEVLHCEAWRQEAPVCLDVFCRFSKRLNSTPCAVHTRSQVRQWVRPACGRRRRSTMGMVVEQPPPETTAQPRSVLQARRPRQRAQSATWRRAWRLRSAKSGRWRCGCSASMWAAGPWLSD